MIFRTMCVTKMPKVTKLTIEGRCLFINAEKKPSAYLQNKETIVRDAPLPTITLKGLKHSLADIRKNLERGFCSNTIEANYYYKVRASLIFEIDNRRISGVTVLNFLYFSETKSMEDIVDRIRAACVSIPLANENTNFSPR